MAKWFKEFPINLKNGADRIRSASESGSQSKASKAGLVASIGTKPVSSKTGHRKNSTADGPAGGAGGVGSLLSGRNRKNSATELNRNGANSSRDGKVWDNLLSGKSRKNVKAEVPIEEQHRPLQKSPSANAYMNRLIRVDTQDKSPNFSSSSVTSKVVPEAEKTTPCRTETVSSRLIFKKNILMVLTKKKKFISWFYLLLIYCRLMCKYSKLKSVQFNINPSILNFLII